MPLIFIRTYVDIKTYLGRFRGTIVVVESAVLVVSKALTKLISSARSVLALPLNGIKTKN